MTTQAPFLPSTSTPQWEPRRSSPSTGFVTPPRFQQLQAQAAQSLAQQPAQNHLQFPSSNHPSPANNFSTDSSSDMPPHTRSPSFFSPFRRQSNESQPNINQRATSTNGGTNLNAPTSQQQNAPSTPMQQVQPPPQTNLYGQQQQTPQQQIPPNSQPAMGQQQGAMGRTTTDVQPPPTAPSPSKTQPPAPLHPEIRSVVQLTIAHAQKIYFSGPLVRRIERQADGQRPTKDEGWVDVWAQLGGTTLSVWDMKEIQEASKQGREVPPTYVNVMDAFVQVLGSVTVPATATSGPKRYTNVLTLNTAGSNLLLFSCPSTNALISWAAALRLSAWEKSRLEEIYTAHLIRITLSARDTPTTLVRGRMEGWARIRIAGQTDWKRVWMVVSASVDGAEGSASPPVSNPTLKKKRMSNLFSRDQSQPQPTGPTKASMSMYLSPKPKDRKRALLTVTDITQVFSVYPERPELISRSTLIKVEGLLGDEEIAAGMRSREGWLLVMPELDPSGGQAAEMLKWIVAMHDAFSLYGRPKGWTWDPRDRTSLMFAYPVGPQKESLFLERELVESLDPRDDRTSVIRSRLIDLLVEHMHPAVQAVPQRPAAQQSSADTPPSLPPIGGAGGNGFGISSVGGTPPMSTTPTNSGTSLQPVPTGPQLPPLNFNGTPPAQERLNVASIPVDTSVTRALLAGTSNPPNAAKPSENGPSSAQSNGPTQPPDNGLSSQPPSNVSPVQLLNNGPSAQSLNNGPQQHQSNQPSSQTQNNGAPAVPEKPASPQSPTFDQPMSNSPQSMNSALSLPSPKTGLPPLSGTTLASTSSGRPSMQSSNSLDKPGLPSLPQGYNKPLEKMSIGSVASVSDIAPTTPLSPNRLGQTNPFAAPQPRMATSPSAIPRRFIAEQTRAKTQDSFGSDSISAYSSDSRLETQPNAAPQRESPEASWQQSSSPPENDFTTEAGALYYMQQTDSASSSKMQATKPAEEDDYSSSDHGSGTPAGSSSINNQQPPARRNTPTSFANEPSTSNPAGTLGTDRVSSARSVLGRKPSGARAPPAMRMYAGDSVSSSLRVNEEESEHEENMDSRNEAPSNVQSAGSFEDQNAEVLAVLSYLDVDDAPSASTSLQKVEPLKVRDRTGTSPPPVSAPPQATSTDSGPPFKSSFAPSKQAAERKAKVQAQQAAHQAAKHKPGRNGKRKSKYAGAWNESTDEEEEEEEEDDADSDGEPVMTRGQSTPSSSSAPSIKPPQNQGGHGDYGQPEAPQTYSHLRPPRTLPQIPGGRPPPDDYHHHQPQPRRAGTDPYIESGRRTYYEENPQIRSQAEYPQPGAARQSMWSQVLEPSGRQQVNQNEPRDTFVQLEPSETMTKAFTPQGLLSAGIQDKQDRSAKRQEELARETGASLINVPNKPPPPQTGLLGAITAHERERKREGGVGAALTEREREKRVAEERQRRFDEQQRQALDQMAQGGSMYGGQFGYNPMMANPMMMGMNPMMGMSPMLTGGMNPMAPMMTGAGGLNPMMTGGGGLNPMMTGGGMGQMNPMMTGQMGFPGMMPGFNPQHMFAAQQAAQAYQQAMMAFSVAGSQVGGDGGAEGQQQMLNPNMTGGGMSMAGFDPRMSMMGMQMMGAPQMGAPMMGAPQMGNPAPLGMQMTGMSGFDARFSPGQTNQAPNLNESNLLPPNQNQGQLSSRTSSPAGRGSPLVRGDGQFDTVRPTRPATPKH